MFLDMENNRTCLSINNQMFILNKAEIQENDDEIQEFR